MTSHRTRRNLFSLVLATLDLGWPLYRHNTQFLSQFAQRRRRISAQVIYRWKLVSGLQFCRWQSVSI